MSTLDWAAFSEADEESRQALFRRAAKLEPAIQVALQSSAKKVCDCFGFGWLGGVWRQKDGGQSSCDFGFSVCFPFAFEFDILEDKEQTIGSDIFTPD